MTARLQRTSTKPHCLPLGMILYSKVASYVPAQRMIAQCFTRPANSDVDPDNVNGNTLGSVISRPMSEPEGGVNSPVRNLSIAGTTCVGLFHFNIRLDKPSIL